jgi:prepilin-type N-terminal cleavage/methylation domain-containing protein
MHSERGFTVPELVVVIVILLGLALSLSLIRPKHFETQEYDYQQKTNVAHLLQLIERYRQVHGGLPADFPQEEVPVASVDGYDLCKLVVPALAKDLPIDSIDGIKTLDDAGVTNLPCNHEGVRYTTGYFVSSDSTGRVTVGSQNSLTGDVYDLSR